ncbi:S-adenosylmethionine-dependent methyltransferase [Klebsormidium nitens]|uniref:S-adenosylmethionine-dependent methyltransferase n=1 Tax=Klebsormidium nitens TaxID=105231 RepID=A0A1Y1HQ50_KLENI|nr:S-adenosylmethionine-dependent methyltransferase [Klebsormidium nitens]|eukprot:GAQ79111.1 S-adenosylmethionine-dependent methyltransferase [Klebsormidium nitens]
MAKTWTIFTGILASIVLLTAAVSFSQSNTDSSGLPSLLRTTSCLPKNCSQECQPAYGEVTLLKQRLAETLGDRDAERRKGEETVAKLQEEIATERRNSTELLDTLKQLIEGLKLELIEGQKNRSEAVATLQAEVEVEKQRSGQLVKDLEEESAADSQNRTAIALIPPIPSAEDVQRDVETVKRLKLLDAVQSGKEWNTRRRGIFPKKSTAQWVEYCETLAHENQASLEAGQIAVPPELLAEAHHNYYGAPWALGRDIFEFLVNKTNLQPSHRVLDVGCGSMRVGIHFIAYLEPGHYACIEADALSLAAGLLYELPVNGLLQKRPQVISSNTFDTSGLTPKSFDLVFASAVLIHVDTREKVWDALGKFERLLVPKTGRLFTSHNMKWCEAPTAESDCPTPEVLEAMAMVAPSLV